MSKCVYCLKEIGDKYQECPFCGFPVSVPFTVKNVKQKWKQDMYTKTFKIEPSLDAIHRAEKAEQEGGQNPQRDRQQQRPPQRPPQQNRPHPQQPWGQAPQYPPQNPQYPQSPVGYTPQQPGYGYPQAPQQPQAPQYPTYPPYPNPNQQWAATPTEPQQPQPQPQQPAHVPNNTAPQKQPTPPSRSYDAELFNDWLT